MTTRGCVFQDWMFDLSLQQQSVLMLACRGPDGIAKFHPCKQLVAAYRATVMKAAYLGRPMRIGEGDNTTFMSLRGFENDNQWNDITKDFFNHIDELPHHYYMHLMHGAQIIGYHHPHTFFNWRWGLFYIKVCNDLHVKPETVVEMDHRLGDWNQEHWDNPIEAQFGEPPASYELKPAKRVA